MEIESTVLAIAPGLLRFCTGIMGSASEGEDLAQESLAALVRFWHQNGPPESAAAFVYAVARRQSRRFRLRWRRFLAMDPVDSRADPAPGPEDESVHRQGVERALAAMRVLPRRELEALLVAIDGDISSAEAAQALGVSVSAFKMRVHRARRRLLRHLEDGHGTSGRETSW
jgi:RNA polymerase sigma-70 factor (ECF subfamily)